MKKIMLTFTTFIFVCILFIACEKNQSSASISTVQTSNCADSIYLFKDASYSCNGKNYFTNIFDNSKNYVTNTGIVAIDTIVGDAFFKITFDTLPGTTACGGLIFKNASVSCYERVK